MANQVKKINSFQVRTENALKLYHEEQELNIYGNKFDGVNQSAMMEIIDRKTGQSVRHFFTNDEFKEAVAFLVELSERKRETPFNKQEELNDE